MRGALTATGRHSNGVGGARIGRWAMAASGLGLALYGLTRRTPGGFGLALAGGGVLYQATRGRRGPDGPAHLRVEKIITINRPVDEVYQFWRNLENLPRFMRHLASVTNTGDQRSHWVARAPVQSAISWEAKIVDEQPNRLLAWRSVEGSTVPNTGTVTFQEAPGGRGTEVHVSLEYQPPGGTLGETIARLFGEDPAHQIEEDLRHFKQIMEAGEIPTTEGQSAGRPPGTRPIEEWARILRQTIEAGQALTTERPSTGRRARREMLRL